MLSRNGLQDVGCKVWSICRKLQWLKGGEGGGAEFEQTSPQKFKCPGDGGEGGGN